MAAPAPTPWIDGPQRQAETCSIPVDTFLPPYICGCVISSGVFIAAWVVYEQYLRNVKNSPAGVVGFLPPPIFITMFRYFFFQFTFQNVFSVSLFISFRRLDAEIACYIQRYSDGDPFYGCLGNVIVFAFLVYIHVMVNWIIRPAAGRRIATAFSKHITGRQEDVDTNQTKQFLYVGTLDGFHATKLACDLSLSSPTFSFIIYCVDAYGSIGMSTTAIERNINALELAAHMTVVTAPRVGEGAIQLPASIRNHKMDFVMILGDYLWRHPIVGLEYEDSIIVQEHRVIELLDEIQLSLAQSGSLLVAVSSSDEALIKRWCKVLKKSEFEIIEHESCESSRLGPGRAGTYCASSAGVTIIEASRRSSTEPNVTYGESASVTTDPANARSLVYYVWLPTCTCAILVYIVLFSLTVVYFHSLTVPSEVGLALYFNNFMLTLSIQLPPSLIIGLYLLYVKINRSSSDGLAAAQGVALKYLLAALVVGSVQSFVFGYLYAMLINYFFLFKVFGVPTNSFRAVMIDFGLTCAILWIFQIFLRFTKKEEGDNTRSTSGLPSDVDSNPMLPNGRESNIPLLLTNTSV